MKFKSVVCAVVIALPTLLSACEAKVAGGRADGPAIFREVCARCHGPKGEPNASMVARYGVRSLRSDRMRTEVSDAEIREQILKGSKNKQMPSFEGAISDAQIDAVIAHVRTLAAAPASAPAPTPAPSPAPSATDAK